MNDKSHGQTAGNPHTAYTSESAVWEKAQENGKAAASWVFDGNTTMETFQHVLKGIQNVDPGIMDALRVPSLSGEYSDEFSEQDLIEEVNWVPHDGTETLSDLCDQYNDEVSTAFWEAVERVALEHINDHFKTSMLEELQAMANCLLEVTAKANERNWSEVSRHLSGLSDSLEGIEDMLESIQEFVE